MVVVSFEGSNRASAVRGVRFVPLNCVFLPQITQIYQIIISHSSFFILHLINLCNLW